MLLRARGGDATTGEAAGTYGGDGVEGGDGGDGGEDGGSGGEGGRGGGKGESDGQVHGAEPTHTTTMARARSSSSVAHSA